jgi:phytoene dehydrogenase-like protein
MGYMGGETLTEMKQFAVELVSGVIPSRLMANWFVPTLADPSQAPEGHHTAFVWLDVPPIPRRWGDRNLPYRFTIWDEIKWELTEAVTDLFERYAPGFKDLILDIFPYSPLDIYRNNPSAIKGNWNGGSLLPDQFYNLRPLPFVMKEGSASRTIIPNLYLSNSIHPHGATWLASGYLSAREVAEDLNCDVSRAFRSKSALFYVSNLHRFPRNLGVPARWQTVQR